MLTWIHWQEMSGTCLYHMFLIFTSSVRKIAKYFRIRQSYFYFQLYSMTLTSVKKTHAKMEEHAPVVD